MSVFRGEAAITSGSRQVDHGTRDSRERPKILEAKAGLSMIPSFLKSSNTPSRYMLATRRCLLWPLVRGYR